jgi:prophage DNA circulation protein
MAFFDDLVPASIGGVPFGVVGNESTFGRRIALHQYPFRDTPWPEDIGRLARTFEVSGFLLENDLIYQGGSVIDQRDALVEVAETPGPITLMHPTFGEVSVAIYSISIREQWDNGQYFEISLSCVEAGEREFPSIDSDTGAEVDSAADDADSASALDFLAAVQSSINSARAVVATAVNTVANYVVQATAAAQDATALFGMVTELPGTFGRFAGGATAGFMGSNKPYNGTSPTIPQLLATGGANRAAVATAGGAVAASTAEADWPSVTTHMQALVASVIAATVDPADGVRIAVSLCSFTPTGYFTSSAIGAAMQGMSTAVGNLCRRAAITALARASATYQPASSTAAYVLRNIVTGLIDNEMLIAGNDGEDDTFNALRYVRQAVVNDLNTRGALLPQLRVYQFPSSLPSATIALRLYRDAGRADEVAQESGAPHPAFQPLSIRMLAW